MMCWCSFINDQSTAFCWQISYGVLSFCRPELCCHVVHSFVNKSYLVPEVQNPIDDLGASLFNNFHQFKMWFTNTKSNRSPFSKKKKKEKRKEKKKSPIHPIKLQVADHKININNNKLERYWRIHIKCDYNKENGNYNYR